MRRRLVTMGTVLGALALTSCSSHATTLPVQAPTTASSAPAPSTSAPAPRADGSFTGIAYYDVDRGRIVDADGRATEVTWTASMSAIAKDPDTGIWTAQLLPDDGDHPYAVGYFNARKPRRSNDTFFVDQSTRYGTAVSGDGTLTYLDPDALTKHWDVFSDGADGTGHHWELDTLSPDLGLVGTLPNGDLVVNYRARARILPSRAVRVAMSKTPTLGDVDGIAEAVDPRGVIVVKLPASNDMPCWGFVTEKGAVQGHGLCGPDRLTYSPDGSYLLAMSRHHVTLIDAGTRDPIVQFSPPAGGRIAMTPGWDGDRAVLPFYRHGHWHLVSLTPDGAQVEPGIHPWGGWGPPPWVFGPPPPTSGFGPSY